MMKWTAQAPSNIALIKYMGKLDHKRNIPSNSSLSYTLNNLRSTVELTLIDTKTDQWKPLEQDNLPALQLNHAGQERFLQHLVFLKQYFQYSGHFIVRSANNFPQGTGLASSASSFAALTTCAVQALAELTDAEPISTEQIAILSRHGSGSSCRSFFSPWALWTADNIQAIELPYPNLIHHVVLISEAVKQVSSSQAHQRIQTSPLFTTRTQGATENLKHLLEALQKKNWHTTFSVCWQEFTDMQQLFTSAKPAFSYLTPASEQALEYLQTYWQDNDDGPLVTMDAGPNIHLLFRPDQAALAKTLTDELRLRHYHVL